mgnify:CR=1 FL=1
MGQANDTYLRLTFIKAKEGSNYSENLTQKFARLHKQRIEDVISKVTNFGESCGLSSSISEPLWRKLIDLSIEHEFRELESIEKSN